MPDVFEVLGNDHELTAQRAAELGDEIAAAKQAAPAGR
jgi:hypothetical protein